MAVKVAEYLGQRTDVDQPQIKPTALNPGVAPTCPFMGGPCTKLKGKKSYPPVCSVRTDSGNLFAVCSDRLIPAKANVLTAQHVDLLGQVGEELFPSVPDESILFKRQQGVRVVDGTVYLDYVLVAHDASFQGRRAAIVEVQGGGETSNTGTISEHIAKWADSKNRSNELLRESFVNVGLIPDNAWKRQLRQILRKAPLARRFNGAFALVMGPTLFDYVVRSVPSGRSWYPEREVALIEVKETVNRNPGPIPLQVGQALFMTYPEFITAVSEPELPDDLVNPFLGSFLSLHNKQVTL
ncbi:MAG: hypothetical protein H3C58_14795 [Fimbriimonadaceae bacterium]|nr:hypothetical protein [Fimbriimonadaceae bacterium]